MNWMDFNKSADFWKAWQEGFKPSSSSNGSDTLQGLWSSQEQFWKAAIDQTGKMFGNQPDLARQWQDLQSGFMKQWSQLAQSASERAGNGNMADPAAYMKRFSEETEKWFAGAFRDKLPEQLRPHFQAYIDMYRMFSQQWENMQAMVRSGLVDPKTVWQWVNPQQYGDAMGKIMGFKPMKDLDEVIRQANKFFDQMRSMVIQMIPTTEERMMDMGESFQQWSNNQAQSMFPFLHGMQEMMKQNLEPYLNAAGQDTQAEVLRQLKDMHFSYLAYLNHSYQMQRMVMDAGAKVLPEMLQEVRNTYTEKGGEMPNMDDFFRQYMDRLEAAILDVMHTPEYTEVQNAVMKSGTTSKRIYDDMMEVVLKDLPFMTKKDADSLIQETTILKRRVRELEVAMKAAAKKETPVKVKAPEANAPEAKAAEAKTPETKKAEAKTLETKKAETKTPATKKTTVSPQEDLINRVGEAIHKAQDDLTLIKGVGEKLSNMLVEIGIRSFDQIAKMDDYTYDLVDALIPAFKGRAKRDEWAAQAKKLVKRNTLV